MEKIADFYLRKIVTHPKFNSANPVDAQELLFPDFKAAWTKCVAAYKKLYPGQDLALTETYRSNVLQGKYFTQGASKIKENGMHHYGVAGDTIFIIDGKRSYKGDVVAIRKIYKDSGLTILGMWDALHVQFISVADQQKLRTAVKNKLVDFQKKNNLPPTGIADAKTIALAKKTFG